MRKVRCFFGLTYLLNDFELGTTILMVVAEESQSQIGIRSLSGGGIRKENGHENLVRRDQRTVTRWSFAKGLGARRSVVIKHENASLVYSLAD